MSTKEKVSNAIKDQNFWLNLVLLVGGFWVGFNGEEATALVGHVFAVIGGVGALANFFKNAELDWRRWLSNANFWNYLAVLLVMLVPEIPSEVIDSVEQIVQALLSKNYQALIGALFTLATFLYKIFTTKKEEPDPDPANV